MRVVFLLAMLVAVCSVLFLEGANAQEAGAKAGPATWIAQTLSGASSTGGAKFTSEAQNVVFVTDAGDSDDYTLKFATDLRKITAIKLEVFPDERIAGGGPGHAENGNFKVDEFSLSAAPRSDPSRVEPVKLQNVSVDYCQRRGGAPEKTIDGLPETSGWGIDGQRGRPHAVVYETASDVGFDGGTVFTVTILQRWGKKHTIGKFRLLLTTAQRPVRVEGPPAELTAVATASTPTSIAQTSIAQTSIAQPASPLTPSAKPAPELSPAPVVKRDPPSGDALQTAQKNVDAVYDDKSGKAKTSTLKAELAKSILADAVATSDDWPSRYVMLEKVRDLATSAGDAATALEAIAELHNDFKGDPEAMQLETLRALAKGAKLSTQAKPLLEAMLPLVDAALAAEHYDTAKTLLPLATDVARVARDFAQVKSLTARASEIDRLAQSHRAMQAALATLELRPADPAANLAVGRHLCLIKGEWDRGLPMLLLGADPTLKAAAKADLLSPTGGETQAAVGDAWWDQAEREQEIVKDRLLGRAALWYRAAADNEGIAGLAKARIEKRLVSVASIAGDSSAADSPAAESTAPSGRNKRFATGTMYFSADDVAQVRINGKEVATMKHPVVAVKLTIKVGDLITVAGVDERYERGFLCFFRSDDGRVVFISDVTSWKQYTPADPNNWWDVKPSPNHAAAKHAHKNYLKMPESAGYGPDPVWGDDKTAYIYHVVNADDLTEAVPRSRARKPAQGAVSGAFYALSDSFGDVMINGVPAMQLREKSESLIYDLRPGDLITAKISNVQYGSGFMLVFVSKDGKSRVMTNAATWRAYTPVKTQRWWDVRPGPNDPPAVQRTKVEPQWVLAVPTSPEGTPAPIWGLGKEISFVYHVVTADELRSAK